jgi:acetyltransferase-like isoleucine patch superfamily enzyme
MRQLKNIILLLMRPFQIINNMIRQLRLFVIPNLPVIISRRLEFDGLFPRCYQLTGITGHGKVQVGKECIFGTRSGGFHRGGKIEFQARFREASILIGANVHTNNNIFICAGNKIEIGNNTLIGQNVTIMDFEAHGIDPDKRRQVGEIGQVVVGENVWIGNNVTILKNTKIGDNSIVATGSVVTHSFPANVIIGGVPAKIIRNI